MIVFACVNKAAFIFQQAMGSMDKERNRTAEKLLEEPV